MKITNTSPLPKSISSIFPNRIAGTVAEVLFLLMVGMVAIAIHDKLRIPLQIPGRHGIIFLTVIVVARGLSRFPFAATIACTGSAALLATSWMGFHEPLMPVIYIVVGITLDVLYAVFRKSASFFLATALSCSFGWMCIPLVKFLLASFTGFYFTSLRFGLGWPVLTHIIFGFAGGLLGASLLKIFSHFSKK